AASISPALSSRATQRKEQGSNCYATGPSLPRRAEAMQARAMNLEPEFGAVGSWVQAARQLPEQGRMIHVHDMRHLMRGEVIEHERRRENQAPREIEPTGRRAGAPAAYRIAQHDAARLDAELLRVPGDSGLEVLARLALEEVGDATRHMRPLAGNA